MSECQQLQETVGFNKHTPWLKLWACVNMQVCVLYKPECHMCTCSLWALTGYKWYASECSLHRDPFVLSSFQASFTQDEELACWHFRATSYHIFSFSACLSLSLFPLRPSSSLCIAAANPRLPPRNIFTALSPFSFSSGLWKRGRGKNRWIKRGVRWRGNEILYWGRDTDREHWAMYKGIRLGAAAGEHWFESCFFLCFSVSLFSPAAIYVCKSVCVVIFSYFLCAC